VSQGVLFEPGAGDGAAFSRFTPTRAEGLRRLAAFAPRAGRYYADHRNFDPGPGRREGVSGLSPYIRRRLVVEGEAAAAALTRHGARGAEKFVQEVLWRTYWKGWLEQRPSVHRAYREAVRRDRDGLSGGGLRALEAAEGGRTGLEGFDDWALELVETGYLHNHARMWFASIWIFTLKLPWTLGAAFFERHLLDGDPASNTLSWRWVAGLQTPGKTYLATADNIERYTQGRFRPKGLATTAQALHDTAPVFRSPLPPARTTAPAGPALLLLTPEDLALESLPLAGAEIPAVLVWRPRATLEFEPNPVVARFLEGAVEDAATRAASAYPGAEVEIVDGASTALGEGVLGRLARLGVRRVLTPYAPLGDVAEGLADARGRLEAQGAEFVLLRRSWDEALWPLAGRGFFPFKEQAWPLLDNLLAPLLAAEGGG